ncbi:hypothetical protein P6F26_01615 [Roseibacterium sp. SDUM158017]|uniref:hypothetical protein n=1 Tax=Roseicyclus salinarum TaxID=3036773 RepID=UPI0024157DB5|nr:hypothetical protein [Roseibacterium sp. SDUM158017]MDG4647129.1 hypothetical protein [Roseibacterium sp. SDUM158017]
MKRVAVFVTAREGGINIDWTVQTRPVRPRLRASRVGSLPAPYAVEANLNFEPSAGWSRVVAIPHASAPASFEWHLATTQPSRLWIRGLPDSAIPSLGGRRIRRPRPANRAAQDAPSVHARLRMIFDKSHSQSRGQALAAPRAEDC